LPDARSQFLDLGLQRADLRLERGILGLMCLAVQELRLERTVTSTQCGVLAAKGVKRLEQ
jgi:hypothetical protein